MHIILIKFVICASLIFFAGRSVARYADVIAEKMRLSRVWIGVILVAFATSLPELFTGIGSVAFVGAPDLTVGNLFGANSYNLLNIAVIDMLNKGGPILSMVSSGQLLTATVSLVPVMLATVAIALSGSGIHAPQFAGIGIFSIAIFFSYCIMAKIIYNFERKNRRSPEPNEKYKSVSLRKAWTFFGLGAALIVASGIWLAYIGKDISQALNLEESFVGSLFIGLITTLPEITVSIAALLIGAKEIAVANMLGSNLFNMTIIFVDDIFYRKAPILESVSTRHVLQGCCVMVMTAVIILAMVTKTKRKFFNMSWYAPVLAAIFLLGAYLGFYLR